MRLTEYNKKRDFDISTEPKGKMAKTKIQNLKFVMQKHNARNLHYDFRLEHKGVLVSWAVPKGISLDPKVKRLAVHVEDHPLDYANFEGVIPKGEYGAGTVQIWDSGNYYSLKDFSKGLKNGELKIVLNGKKLKGEFHLIRTKDNQWLIFKSKDQFSENETPTNKKSKTKQSKNPFDKVSVELAELSNTIPSGKDWLFETKYDGYRIVAFVENGRVKLATRNNNDYTQKFASIEKALKRHFKDSAVVLDGEIVVVDSSGRSDFSALQNSIKTGKQDFVYCIFDLLAFGGEDLRQEKLQIRKELLRKCLRGCPDNLIFSDYVIGKGKQTFALAKKLGLEGVIAKKIDSTYTGTRSGNWLKIKCYKRQEFVIGGYTTTDKNENLSALLLGYYDQNKLIYVGKVGTGFNQSKRQELRQLFEKHKSDKSYFSDSIKSNEKITYLKPKLVAEIQFAEITKSGNIRQGSFVDIRDDKPPKDVKLEMANEQDN